MLLPWPIFCSSAALVGAATRASDCCCLEVDIRGDEGFVLGKYGELGELGELESRKLCLLVFGGDDGTSSFRPRPSDTRASADLPCHGMMCPEAERQRTKG